MNVQEGERVDGMGKCCPVAEIDACGVCEGLNNTCGATIRLLIVVDPQADGDTVTTVRNYISNTLRYPLALVQVGELEAMDMTEVLPFAGVLTGDTDTDAFNDESKDFMFGRVCRSNAVFPRSLVWCRSTRGTMSGVTLGNVAMIGQA